MPKCHYDVLGVDRDADDTAIKKAHRKLALKFHPDKNRDNPDATEQFRMVQAAYECLSDSHERAWYDDHRDAIIRGYKPGEGDKYEEDDTSHLFQYMSSFCFRGFDEKDDADRNFYTVYRDLFEEIDDEDPIDELERPIFGCQDSEWAVVDEFYAAWEGYSTKRNYASLDQYDTRQAPDRRIRRAMEQENKKVRDQARRERNDVVRELVRFVRKRDPRVERRKEDLAKKAEENKKRQEERRMAELERKMEAAVLYEEQLEDDPEHLRQLEQIAALEAQFEDDSDDNWDNRKDRRKGKKNKKGKKGKQMQYPESEPENAKSEENEDTSKTGPEQPKTVEDQLKEAAADNSEPKANGSGDENPENSELGPSPSKNTPGKKKRRKAKAGKKQDVKIEEVKVEAVEIDESILKLSSDDHESAFTQGSKKKKKKGRR